VFLLALLGLDEFYRMALPARRGEGRVAAVAGACSLFSLFSASPVVPLLTLTSLTLGFCLVALFRLKEIRQAAADVALVLMGFLYVPLLLSHLILIRMLPHGVSWLFLIMVIVMAGDSAAYYVGSSFGKTKLYPAVSPKKSVEGSLGGLAGSVIGALICRSLFFPELTVADCVATALLLGVLGQLGDLFESLIKRSCGVKDSGVIIPGHGGILDRMDSILFAGPAAYYYAYFLFPLG
jgi:phosphatidate cytidylyltransferase